MTDPQITRYTLNAPHRYGMLTEAPDGAWVTYEGLRALLIAQAAQLENTTGLYNAIRTALGPYARSIEDGPLDIIAHLGAQLIAQAAQLKEIDG